MNFSSWSEFFAMGGHGLYVWLCYGVGLIVFIAMIAAAKSQRKQIVKQILQQQRRQAAREQDSLGNGKV